MLAYMPTPAPKSRTFYLKAGDTLNELLDWDAWSVKVDNFTSQWVHFPDSDAFVPPAVLNAVANTTNTKYAQAEFAPPRGVTQVTATAGTWAKLVFYDQWFPSTPGFPTRFTNSALVSLNVPIVLPDLGAALAVQANNVAWTYGNWVQLAAANVLANHALMYLSCWNGSSSSSQIQVGIGNPQTIAGTYGFEVSSASSTVTLPVIPLLAITPNASLWLRCAAAVGGSTSNLRMGLCPLPL